MVTDCTGQFIPLECFYKLQAFYFCILLDLIGKGDSDGNFVTGDGAALFFDVFDFVKSVIDIFTISGGTVGW